MSLALRFAFELPRLPFIRQRLERAGFVFSPDRQTERFSEVVGSLDQRFFASASGSVTSTVRCWRLRVAVPVGHQDCARCQV